MRKTVPTTAAIVLATSLCAAAQDFAPDGLDDAMAALPLDDAFPTYRPDIPRPVTTQPATRPADEEKIARENLTDDWLGYRSKLAGKGIAFDLRAIFEAHKNLAGGIDTERTTGQYLLNANLLIDTEKLFNWTGGTLFASYQNQGGVDPSAKQVGDFQGVSNISADGRSQLSELWYQQDLVDKKFQVKVGKIDAGGSFGLADYAADFLNGAMGFATFLAPIPTYPDPAAGLELWAYPCEHFYIGGGVYDGAGQRGVRTGENGIKTAFGKPADLFLVAETGVRWKLGRDQLPGRLRLGAWRATGDFPNSSGGKTDGNNGAYVAVEHRLVKEHPDAADDEQGLAGFVTYDWAEPEASGADHHASAGLAWTGPVPSRDADVAGLGVSWIHFAPDAGFTEDSETAVETFYKFSLGYGVSVKPDLQYILSPGGTNRDHALVASVRIEISL